VQHSVGSDVAATAAESDESSAGGCFPSAIVVAAATIWVFAVSEVAMSASLP